MTKLHPDAAVPDAAQCRRRGRKRKRKASTDSEEESDNELEAELDLDDLDDLEAAASEVKSVDQNKTSYTSAKDSPSDSEFTTPSSQVARQRKAKVIFDL